MKIGIVGFASSGKTTVFNALTGQDAPTGYGGEKVNLGTIKVPDERVEQLAAIDNPKKVTFAEITFADVPGGRGGTTLAPRTLGQIREMDALVQVVRCFDDGSGSTDPAGEHEGFVAELTLGDMQVAEKRIERLAKDRSDQRQLKLLERCLEHLGEGLPLRALDLSADDLTSLAGFAFLSLKPLMVVASLPEDRAAEGLPAELASLTGDGGLTVVPLCGAIESEIAALDPDDQAEFLRDLGLEQPAGPRFVQAAFGMLRLVSFLTRGPDECRAWPLREGSTAVEAAAVVHSDIARGFIRAEVTRWEDFVELGSEAACRDAGKLRVEGRDYVVQDGDICHFRFNV